MDGINEIKKIIIKLLFIEDFYLCVLMLMCIISFNFYNNLIKKVKCYPHFIDEDTERLRDLPEITQLVNDKVRIQIQAV